MEGQDGVLGFAGFRGVLHVIHSLSGHNVLILASGNPGYAGAASPRRELPENQANMIISGQICLSINGWAIIIRETENE